MRRPRLPEGRCSPLRKRERGDLVHRSARGEIAPYPSSGVILPKSPELWLAARQYPRDKLDARWIAVLGHDAQQRLSKRLGTGARPARSCGASVSQFDLEAQVLLRPVVDNEPPAHRPNLSIGARERVAQFFRKTFAGSLWRALTPCRFIGLCGASLRFNVTSLNLSDSAPRSWPGSGRRLRRPDSPERRRCSRRRRPRRAHGPPALPRTR